MISVSTKGRYGLQALLELAQHESREPMQLAAIARRQKVSAKYLHALLKTLVGAGVVESVRGAHGGYRLARDSAEITVKDALVALEGRHSGRGVAQSRGAAAVAELLAEVAGRVDQVLASFTIEDLATRASQRDADPMYFI